MPAGAMNFTHESVSLVCITVGASVRLMKDGPLRVLHEIQLLPALRLSKSWLQWRFADVHLQACSTSGCRTDPCLTAAADLMTSGKTLEYQPLFQRRYLSIYLSSAEDRAKQDTNIF